MASKHDTHKLIAGQYLANLGVTSGKIATSAVITTKIADLAVTTGKINTGAISSAKLAAVAVRTAAIGTSQVTTTKIADGDVTAGKLGTSAATTTKIADLAVTTGKINTGAISSAKLAAVAVRTAAIGTSQVTTTKIADGDVTAGKLDTSAVTTVKISDRNVTSAKIATSGVTLAKLTSALRRGHIVRHITETAATRQLFGGNSTTGMLFFAALRLRSAQLIWNGSTSGSCLRVTVLKNASTVCVLGTTVTPGKKWFNHSSTSGQFANNTFAITDRFRAQTTIWSNPKVSVGVPVLVIEYQLT